jgi:hypothetical protein
MLYKILVKLSIKKIGKKKNTNKGAVISGPRVKAVPFGKDAKGIEFPSGESIDLGQ